ncbi:MAG: carbonic anhydrase [Deltaproteobacteria bacterium]|nr:carbonic anhydrase [Deltaproteobacteria bacterium]
MSNNKAIYDRVFENNKQWVAAQNAADAQFFSKLAADQNPDFLFIGCSDSRVPANEIMGLEAGDVFVHRNVANVVANTDANVMAVIQYAVENLKVKHVVVCGHYGCGGVNAAMTPQDLGGLNGWLREIRDVYRIHRNELNAIEDEKTRYRRLVELNVQEQCVNVIKTAFVQKSHLHNKMPTVHGWVFDLADGFLKDLELDFDAILSEIQEIYRLDE